MEITVSQGRNIKLNTEAAPCECGNKPNFHMGYGRMPYSINCKCGIYTHNEITCCTPTYGVAAYNRWRANPEDNEFNFKQSRP